MGAIGVGEAVRELNDVLGLRDCAIDQRMHFADQPELFSIFPRTPGCIRFEVKKCLGPCVGGCSVQQYDERFALARAFLDGADDGPMERLRARDGSGERAAGVRARRGRCATRCKRLEALRGQFARLRFAVETLSFVYNVPGYDGDDRVYLIRRGHVRAEIAGAARRRRGGASARHDRRASSRRPSASPAQIPTHEIDELLLLSSWFRRFPEELERTSAAQRRSDRRRRRRPLVSPSLAQRASRELARLLHALDARARPRATGHCGALMTISWQPTTLVQCVSTRPWLTTRAATSPAAATTSRSARSTRCSASRETGRFTGSSTTRARIPLPVSHFTCDLDVTERTDGASGSTDRSTARSLHRAIAG